MSVAITESLRLHVRWLTRILDARMRSYFMQDGGDEMQLPPPFPAPTPGSPLDEFFENNDFTWQERVTLLLALCPYIQPRILDIFFQENTNINRIFTEFGGVKGNTHGGFLPTSETVLFLLSGSQIGDRIEAMKLLQPEHWLFSEEVLVWMPIERDEHPLRAQLTVSETYRRRFLWNEAYEPSIGPQFSAQKLTTELNWDDLVLEPSTMEQVLVVKSWLESEDQINEKWGVKKWVKPGYRCLFYGAPGTGKTLTASLLGKELGRRVLRKNLSTTLSGYIGETEKNIARFFDQAQKNAWILFFDEADSLFGKRTGVRSGQDRYANQEISYLLQRIETYSGLVIFAANIRDNIDTDLQQRFQTVINFPVPDAQQRLRLWRQMFSGPLQPEPSVNLEEMADRYELTGGEIASVLQGVAIRAARNSSEEVRGQDLLHEIRQVFRKSGKVVKVR